MRLRTNVPASALAAILILASAGLAAPASAQVHEDFSAAFPAAPQVQSDGGARRYVDDEMNVVFEVDVLTGADAVPGAKADHRRLKAFGRRTHSKMRSSGPASLSGQPAAQAVFVDSSGAEATVRTIAHDGRAYLVIYQHAQYQGSDAERDGFLNSFRFVP